MNSSNIITNNESHTMRNSASRITEVDKANKEFLDTSNNQKKKTDVSEFSHSKTQDKSPSRVLENKNFSSHTNNSNISSPYKNRSASPDFSPNKKLRSKTEKEGGNKKFKKKVTFKEKNFLDIVTVESFKKYNVDMSFNEMEPHESIRCKCIIY